MPVRETCVPPWAWPLPYTRKFSGCCIALDWPECSEMLSVCLSALLIYQRHPRVRRGRRCPARPAKSHARTYGDLTWPFQSSCSQPSSVDLPPLCFMTHGSKCMHAWGILDVRQLDPWSRSLHARRGPAAAPAFPAPAGKEILGDPALTWACTGRDRSSRRKAWASWWLWWPPVPRVLHGSSFNACSSPAYDDLRIIVEAGTLFHSFNEFSLCSKMIPTLSIDVSGRRNLKNDIIQMCLVASLAFTV